MFAKRVLVAAILLPLGLIVIYYGGWLYTAVIALILCGAAYEYIQLFRHAGLRPAAFLIIPFTALIVLSQKWNGFANSPWIISLFVLSSMTYHLLAFERGREQAGTDFGITLGGGLYIGWIGAYLVALRNLPEGLWWVMLALPAVWLADTGAYVVGSRIGRHKMTPRLSPKKSWEGYVGGLVFSIIGTALLSLAWRNFTTPDTLITPLRAGLLGLIIGALTILGDLGESMIKRQVGVKDSGKLLPGHGGVFDRIDSWLWAGVIAYYVITWLFLSPKFGL
jgi:phosphatidate cytidylyltransferase